MEEKLDIIDISGNTNNLNLILNSNNTIISNNINNIENNNTPNLEYLLLIKDEDVILTKEGVQTWKDANNFNAALNWPGTILYSDAGSPKEGTIGKRDKLFKRAPFHLLFDRNLRPISFNEKKFEEWNTFFENQKIDTNLEPFNLKGKGIIDLKDEFVTQFTTMPSGYDPEKIFKKLDNGWKLDYSNSPFLGNNLTQGCLLTKKSYKNYILSLDITFPNEGGGGIWLHGTGSPGSQSFINNNFGSTQFELSLMSSILKDTRFNNILPFTGEQYNYIKTNSKYATSKHNYKFYVKEDLIGFKLDNEIMKYRNKDTGIVSSIQPMYNKFEFLAKDINYKGHIGFQLVNSTTIYENITIEDLDDKKWEEFKNESGADFLDPNFEETKYQKTFMWTNIGAKKYNIIEGPETPVYKFQLITNNIKETDLYDLVDNDEVLQLLKFSDYPLTTLLSFYINLGSINYYKYLTIKNLSDLKIFIKQVLNFAPKLFFGPFLEAWFNEYFVITKLGVENIDAIGYSENIKSKIQINDTIPLDLEEEKIKDLLKKRYIRFNNGYSSPQYLE